MTIHESAVVSIIVAVSKVSFTTVQLQKKYKHAIDFGVKGSYNLANFTKFKSVLGHHVKTSEKTYKLL